MCTHKPHTPLGIEAAYMGSKGKAVRCQARRGHTLLPRRLVLQRLPLLDRDTKGPAGKAGEGLSEKLGVKDGFPPPFQLLQGGSP